MFNILVMFWCLRFSDPPGSFPETGLPGSVHRPVRVGMGRFSTEQNPGDYEPQMFPKPWCFTDEQNFGAQFILRMNPKNPNVSLTLVLRIGQPGALPETTDALELQSA